MGGLLGLRLVSSGVCFYAENLIDGTHSKLYFRMGLMNMIVVWPVASELHNRVCIWSLRRWSIRVYICCDTGIFLNGVAKRVAKHCFGKTLVTCCWSRCMQAFIVIL